MQTFEYINSLRSLLHSALEIKNQYNSLELGPMTTETYLEVLRRRMDILELEYKIQDDLMKLIYQKENTNAD